MASNKFTDELNTNFYDSIETLISNFQDSDFHKIMLNFVETIEYIRETYAEDILKFINTAKYFYQEYQNFCIAIFNNYFTEENLKLANELINLITSIETTFIDKLKYELITNAELIQEIPKEKQNDYILNTSISIYLWITDKIDKILDPYVNENPTLKISVVVTLLETLTNDNIYQHFSKPVQDIFDIMINIFIVLLFRYGWVLLSNNESND